MSMLAPRARGFGLVEAIVVLGIATLSLVMLVPALQLAASPRRAACRDQARRLARNVLARVRAAGAYDAQASGAVAAALPATWTLPARCLRDAGTAQARITLTGGTAGVTVTVTLEDALVALHEPLQARAPLPNSLLGPVGP
ncbi:hypothetical protein EPN52_01750 [bacterium]|nr:MAG: hypothetical protein EPN52_01750 [bacterium]